MATKKILGHNSYKFFVPIISPLKAAVVVEKKKFSGFEPLTRALEFLVSDFFFAKRAFQRGRLLVLLPARGLRKDVNWSFPACVFRRVPIGLPRRAKFLILLTTRQRSWNSMFI